MSLQTRYGITFGSGPRGMEVEKRLRTAAQIEKLPFSKWVTHTLVARAEMVLSQAQAQPNPGAGVDKRPVA